MEPHVYPLDESGRRRGWIEVVCGSMFSGKTEELIRRLRRARFARQKVALFKPALDTRYADAEVVSHDATAMPSEVVHTAEPMLLLAGDADVVGIDEAQFFGSELVDVVQALAGDGRRVVLAGLDQDYLGRPFEPVPQLMAVAEHVTKLHAVCVRCGAPANHSQRIVASGGRVLVGESEAYEPRCRQCFRPEAVEAVPVSLPTSRTPVTPVPSSRHALSEAEGTPAEPARTPDPTLAL
ncbi:thymidine kinase [Rubrivirga sp.]|uniref:thymidine kinase n=1 Tax=Rubrivirga sp. TaxID=1885344 RepID=UPI003C75DF61